MRGVCIAIKNMCCFLLMLVMVSCIHTYPSGDGVDPTLVKLGIELSFDINWQPIDYPLSKSDEIDSGHEYRLIIEFSRNDNYVGRYEHFLSREEYSLGTIRIGIPFDFHAVSYKAAIWLDCVDTLSHNSVHYDAKYMSSIARTDHHILWNNEKECAFGFTDINLQKYKDNWGSKVIVPIRLSSPLGRFKIIATDMAEFKEYVTESVRNGEKYFVCVAFEGNLAQEFSVIDNFPVNYLDNPEFYFALSSDDLQADKPEIVNAAVFTGDDGDMITAKILVYNSARIIISKSPVIQFPVERGKVTIITGALLTEYYTNTINVNNIWDGEIIIEI